jgi:hypothetical protein
MNLLFILITVLGSAVLAISVQPVAAANVTDKLLDSFEASELPSTGADSPDAAAAGLQRVVGLAINGFISIFGVIFLSLMIYGGYKWLLAAGREDQVSKAKGIIQSAAIGLIIVLLAFVISFYILDVLLDATQKVQSNPQQAPNNQIPPVNIT